MRAVVDQDTSTRTISIGIVDGVEIDTTQSWQRKPRIIRVDVAEICVRDGVTQYIEVSGWIVRKNGTLSETLRGTKAWGASRYGAHPIDEAPEWVRELFDQAPIGITEYTWTDKELTE